MHILPVPLLVNIKNKQTKKNFFRWNIDPIWHDEAIEGIYCRVCWTFRCWRSKLQQNKIKATDFSQLLWENGMVDRKHWALPTSSVGVKSAQMWKVCYRWGTSKPISIDGPQYWWKGERGWLGVRKYWILGLGTVDKCLLRWGQQGHLVRRLWNWLAMQICPRSQCVWLGAGAECLPCTPCRTRTKSCVEKADSFYLSRQIRLKSDSVISSLVTMYTSSCFAHALGFPNWISWVVTAWVSLLLNFNKFF